MWDKKRPSTAIRSLIEQLRGDGIIPVPEDERLDHSDGSPTLKELLEAIEALEEPHNTSEVSIIG